MAVSFLDLPVELMLLIIKFIDNVPALKHMLSIKAVRIELASHVKIVLDNRTRRPRAFPFQDVCDVIRASSIMTLSRQCIYLVEIDMTQTSFYSDKFYADYNGRFTGLKGALSNYAFPNAYLFLYIGDPLQDWTCDLEPFGPSKGLVDVFTGIEFGGVHIKPPLPVLQTRVGLASQRITYGDDIPPLTDAHLKSSKSEEGSSLTCPSPLVLDDFIGRTSHMLPKFTIQTDWQRTQKPKRPSGNLLEAREYTWGLQDREWEEKACLDLGTLHLVKNVSLEMKSGGVSPKYRSGRMNESSSLFWDLKLHMAPMDRFDAVLLPETSAPAIKKFRSRTLKSLAIESNVIPPIFDDIDLPYLSTLSLKIAAADERTAEAVASSNLECFRDSAIEFLEIERFDWLTKCPFMSNLLQLEGLRLNTQYEIDSFATVRFPHLHTLRTRIDTTEFERMLTFPFTCSPRLTRLEMTIVCTRHIKLDELSKAYPRLTDLFIEASSFDLSVLSSFEDLVYLHLKFAAVGAHYHTNRTNCKSRYSCNHKTYKNGQLKIPLLIKAPKLEVLDFDYVNFGSDAPVFEFKNFPSLRKLNFKKLAHVTVSVCPSLYKIYGLWSTVSLLTLSLKDTPELRFISYASQDKSVELRSLDTIDGKTPVFLMRRSTFENSTEPWPDFDWWIYTHDSSTPESEMEKPRKLSGVGVDRSDLISNLKSENDYSKTVDGYGDWIEELFRMPDSSYIEYLC